MEASKTYLPDPEIRYSALEKDELSGDEFSEGEDIHHLRPRPNLFARFWKNILLFLTGTALGLSFASLFSEGHSQYSVAGVPTSVTEAVTTRVWQPDDRFALERHDNESAQAWEALQSRFIWVDEPMKKGLPPSYPQGGDRQLYSVAGFHQLHCTWVLYYSWNELVEHGTEILDAEFPNTGGHYTIGNHFSHCVEIIRQALTCYADPTLEPMISLDGVTISESGLSSGWGTTHTCRNFENWVEWLDAQP
ncbi:hypothetical protein F5884DRAFT_897544 [Xylogone sp. PMI_703]|nr:hypothetical protein F5884DRAFT_897544 [Xylogone sp. PMI_703]